MVWRGFRLPNGSWKIICMRRRCGAMRRVAEPRDVRTVEHDRAVGRRHEAQDGLAERGLAAARFAHQPDRLAALQLERDAVDRAQHLLADGIARVQVADGEQRGHSSPSSLAKPPDSRGVSSALWRRSRGTSCISTCAVPSRRPLPLAASRNIRCGMTSHCISMRRPSDRRPRARRARSAAAARGGSRARRSGSAARRNSPSRPPPSRRCPESRSAD